MPRAGIVIAATFLAAMPTHAQELGDPQLGHEFAGEVCAICHGIEAGETVSPLDDAPTFERIATEPGMTGTALAVLLRTPHVSMPDLILAPGDMENVIAYILTLGNGP
jgi:mono/diheme cytochrome c family protein